VSAYIYVEGGGAGADSKYSRIRCQEGFHKLLASMGFSKRKPRLVACGGRGSVFDRFVTANSIGHASYIAMWIDSEEPMANSEKAWQHLESVRTVPPWTRPDGVTDEQVLFMTTCMETWIVADRNVLKEHYGHDLQETALPALTNLEQRPRAEVQAALSHATRNCSNAYSKGKRSFEVLAKLEPAVLDQYLPSFVRVRRILNLHL
jgi:hypothetical protein